MMVIEEMKRDMHLKDEDIFPIYDTVEEKLCPYFGKFVGDALYVIFIDKTETTDDLFTYNVLQKLMTGYFIPVNSYHLFMGRRRANYYEIAVKRYADKHHIEYGKEFVVDVPVFSRVDGVDIPLECQHERCVIYRNCKLFRNGQEDMEFLFRHLLSGEGSD